MPWCSKKTGIWRAAGANFFFDTLRVAGAFSFLRVKGVKDIFGTLRAAGAKIIFLTLRAKGVKKFLIFCAPQVRNCFSVTLRASSLSQQRCPRHSSLLEFLPPAVVT